MIVYVASSNQGKLRDFSAAATSLVLRPLPDLHTMAPPQEDQLTFHGNAELKAVYYSRLAPGLLLVADDSGLEVDALNGAPGVHSARYAERAGWRRGATQDERNTSYLLHRLQAHAADGGGGSAARYRCVLAAARDGTVLATAEGAVEGEILREPRGEGGFGYDPWLLLPRLGRTMAELDQATRISISHRGAALRALLPRLAV